MTAINNHGILREHRLVLFPVSQICNFTLGWTSNPW